MAEWRPTTREDLLAAIENGIAEPVGLSRDALELMTFTGLERSIEVRTYFIEGEMVAVMGLLADSLMGEEAHIWMVTLPAVRKHRFALIRETFRYLRTQPFRKITCLCDPGFADTQRWVRWMGFTLREQVDILGKPYDLFEKAV